MAEVVLVTGVSQDLGARYARALAATGSCEVIGLDMTPPKNDLGGVSYVRADIRSPLLPKTLIQRSVDTLVHLAVTDEGRSRASIKEANILGTMQLIAACQKVPTLRKLVVKSSAAIYGCGPLDPSRFCEEMSERQVHDSGFPRDVSEVEKYSRGLSMRRPEVIVTILRPAPLMGAGVNTKLTRYLSLPVVPKPMGFDARMQFLHPADAAAAFIEVTQHDHQGTFNVAAQDIVTMTQTVRIMGRPTIGVLTGRWAPRLLAASRWAHLGHFTDEELRTITWGRALDTSSFAQRTGLRPHYSSRRAVEEFAALGSPGLLSVDRIDGILEAAARMLAPAPQRQVNHG